MPLRLRASLLLLPCLIVACSGSNGADASPCSVTQSDAGALITCPDGTHASVSPGATPAGSAAPDGGPEPGAATATPLVRTVAEPAGTNCANGGTAILTGIDLNGDGTLADGEVTGRAYLCTTATGSAGTQIQGSFTLRNSLDAALLAGVTKISGDLLVDAAGLTDLELKDLVEVTGSLQINATTLKTFRAPALQRAGALAAQRAALESLATPALVSTDSLVFAGTSSLTTLSLGKPSVGALTISGTGLHDLSAFADVKGVTGTLLISNNTNLTSIAGLAKLTGTIGTFQAFNNPVLTSFTGLDGITGADEVYLRANALATLAGLGGLTTITSDLNVSESPMTSLSALSTLKSVGSIDVSSNDKLTSIGLTALETVGTTCTFAQDPALASLDLPKLKSVGRVLQATNDDALRAVRAPLLTTVGSFFFNATALDEFSMPALTTVGSAVVFPIGGTTKISFPNLTTGTVSVQSYGGLEELTLPKLTSLNALTLYSPSDKLTAVDLSAVTSVASDINVHDAPKLTSVAMPVLKTVGNGVAFINCSSLAALAFPKLESSPYVAFDQNPSLASVDFSHLQTATDSVALTTNASLSTLRLDALQSVGRTLVITRNGLKNCQANAIAAQLTTPPTQGVTISGNTGTGTCP